MKTNNIYSIAIAMRKDHCMDLYKKAKGESNDAVIEALDIALDNDLECSDNRYLFLYWDDGVTLTADWFCDIMEFLRSKNEDYDIAGIDENYCGFVESHTGLHLIDIEQKYWFSEPH